MLIRQTILYLPAQLIGPAPRFVATMVMALAVGLMPDNPRAPVLLRICEVVNGVIVYGLGLLLFYPAPRRNGRQLSFLWRAAI